MFFFFAAGSSTSVLDHGPILPLTCPQCNAVTYWRLYEQKVEDSIYWMTTSSNSNFAIVCQSCHNATPLFPEQVQRAFYLRNVTAGFFEKQVSEEEYRRELEQMRYLH